MVGMNVPAVYIMASAIDMNTPLTIGLVVLLVSVSLAVGETRWQVSHLREWKQKVEAEVSAQQARITALEVREGRTLQRLDDLAARLDRMDAKLDALLARREAA